MIREAVTCDTAGCMGRMLEPADLPETPEYGAEFETFVRASGWVFDPADGHQCPACVTGRPVLELGECLVCGGTTVDLPAGATCHYCRNVTPAAGTTCPRCRSARTEGYGAPIPTTHDDFADCARCLDCGHSWPLDPGANGACTECGGSGDIGGTPAGGPCPCTDQT